MQFNVQRKDHQRTKSAINLVANNPGPKAPSEVSSLLTVRHNAAVDRKVGWHSQLSLDTAGWTPLLSVHSHIALNGWGDL